MKKADPVGIIRGGWSPARWNRVANSSAVRSRPSLKSTIMCKSVKDANNLRDMLLASFACGFARLGCCKDGIEAVLRVRRDLGLLCSEAIAAILLGGDLHDGCDATNSLLTTHGKKIGPLDPVFSMYLFAKGLNVDQVAVGDKVRTNLNRAAVIGNWVGHKKFSEYVTALSVVAEVPVDSRTDMNLSQELLHSKITEVAFRYAVGSRSN
jgi:hypothetical protein